MLSINQSLGDTFTEDDLKLMIDRADLDDDGCIDFSEFSTILDKIKAGK